jgi:hypothetical protein
MSENNSGFRDPDEGRARELLIELGPTLRVDVGFDSTYDSSRPRQPPQLPVEGAWALIDTGASTCCIDRGLAVHLDLPIIDQRIYSGISGPIEVNMHLAQIHVPSLKFTFYGGFAAVELAGARHPILIGRDFLRHFVMTYDGPTGAVNLRDPAAPIPASIGETPDD